MSFITVHILRDLPMHNLNRDQNGLPKSQFDGGIQRGRLSSQSLKRPARIAFRAAVKGLSDAPGSIRTMDSNAGKLVTDRAVEFAEAQGIQLDPAETRKRATTVIRTLAKASKTEDVKPAVDGEATVASKKDNILLFSEAEFDTLAQALVDTRGGDRELTVDDFIQDFRSPSLDVAAFGRMFAARADKATQAAVAVSHAITTHEMALTMDYFTAVDDYEDDEPATSSGAAHLGLAYYTSGVYYSTFTIDPDQLRRSWSGISSETATQQLVALVKAIITALPTGKLSNTNAHTVPFLVLAEHQRGRTVYGFETPVRRGIDGGYKAPTVSALIQQMQLARSFDASNYLAAKLYAPDHADAFEGVDISHDIDSLASWIAEEVVAQTREKSSE